MPPGDPPADDSNLTRLRHRIRVLQRSAERFSYWERHDYVDMLKTTWRRALDLERRGLPESPRWSELDEHLTRVEASMMNRRPLR